jgi:hypothetical protein
MKRESFHLLGVALMLLAVGGLACARITGPAGPPVGPAPTPVVQPPPVPHGLAEECLACHGRDESFLAFLQTGHPVPVPPGFTGSTEEACRLCHDMEKGHTAARAIPHPLEGMEACLTCHGSGTAGVSQIPAAHSGYSVEKCSGCHTPAASGPASAAPGAAAPTPTPAVPDKTSPTPAPSGDDVAPSTPPSPYTPEGAEPPVPHGAAGMEDCLSCHGTALPGMSPMPADHFGQTNQECTRCHS